MQISDKTGSERDKPEPTIALINIVFLMLIFFLIAGTLAAPIDGDLKLINTGELEGREPPDALVVHADGSLTFRQRPTTVADYLASEGSADGAVRIVPDRDLPATKLIDTGHTLRQAGASRIFIVTERSLQ